MQPPGAAFRSSTQTRLPLRTSKAAQTSELMPLPTMTTSKRSRGRILLVGDRGAGRTAEGQDGEASKARLGAPGAKIGAGEVEAIADLEQHAERHHGHSPPRCRSVWVPATAEASWRTGRGRTLDMCAGRTAWSPALRMSLP